MSQSYAIKKKIASLTWIIYNLNIQYETCRESLEELSRNYQEEKRKQDIEFRNLQSKHEDELIQRESEIRGEEQDRLEYEKKTLKEELRFEHEAYVGNLLNAHEEAMSLSSHECSSLNQQLSDLNEDLKVTKRNHRLEVDLLQKRHAEETELAERKHRLELDALIKTNLEEKCDIAKANSFMLHSLESKHLEQLEKQKEAHTNEKDIEIMRIETEWMNRIDEDKLDLKKKHDALLELVETSRKQVGVLNSKLLDANEKVDNLHTCLSQREHTLNLKDCAITKLESSLIEAKQLVEMKQTYCEKERKISAAKEHALRDSVSTLVFESIY